MLVTAVGLSHHSAPLAEVASLTQRCVPISDALASSESLAGFVVLATCNRFEVYVESETFHPALDVVVSTLASAMPEAGGLRDRLDVYAGASAVQHLLEVASGLDSMVVGEAEILGQVRDAISLANHTTPSLTRLFNAALTTGKAVASTTDLGAAGRSLASVGLDLVAQRHGPLVGRRVLLVGTGSDARVVTAALVRAGVTALSVFSSSGRAEQFAATHAAAPVPPEGLASAVAQADLVVTCSGAASERPVITASLCGEHERPFVILDLSLTGDVADDVSTLPHVDLIDLDEVGARAPAEHADAIQSARDLVARGTETYQHLESGRAASPAVTAFRAHVSSYIEREIEQAAKRHDASTAEAVARSLRRVSNALLHTPSQRAAELACAGDLDAYTHALHTLFGITLEPAS